MFLIVVGSVNSLLMPTKWNTINAKLSDLEDTNLRTVEPYVSPVPPMRLVMCKASARRSTRWQYGGEIPLRPQPWSMQTGLLKRIRGGRSALLSCRELRVQPRASFTDGTATPTEFASADSTTPPHDRRRHLFAGAGFEAFDNMAKLFFRFPLAT